MHATAPRHVQRKFRCAKRASLRKGSTNLRSHGRYQPCRRNTREQTSDGRSAIGSPGTSQKSKKRKAPKQRNRKRTVRLRSHLSALPSGSGVPSVACAPAAWHAAAPAGKRRRLRPAHRNVPGCRFVRAHWRLVLRQEARAAPGWFHRSACRCAVHDTAHHPPLTFTFATAANRRRRIWVSA